MKTCFLLIILSILFFCLCGSFIVLIFCSILKIGRAIRAFYAMIRKGGNYGKRKRI